MFFSMKIVDMYQKVVAVVCQTTGIDEYSMFHSNKEVCVDARSILVNVLTERGITEGEISYLTGLTQLSLLDLAWLLISLKKATLKLFSQILA